MSSFAEHIAVDREWLAEREFEWRRREYKFGGLVIKFSGLGFSCLLAVLLIPLPAALTCLFASLMFACAVMLCVCRWDIEVCRRWLDWHAQMRADPYARPWPPLPNE